MGEVEERVNIRQELIADVHGRFTGVDDGGPDVGFLWVSSQGIVVPIEGKEGGELHPAIAEFFIRVAVEPTGINAEHWDPEETER